jgi:Na+/proline symporter
LLGIFILFYLGITLIIGIWISMRVKNASDFILAGRKLPLVFNSFALFALWYGSETIFGASSEFSKKGLLGVIEDPFGGALCLLVYAIFIARPLYRRNFLTLGDLFREKYGQKIEFISSFFMVISFIGYIAAQLVALALLAGVIFGVGFTAGIIGSACFVCIYTLTGGMWAVSITDFIQSLVIMAGMIWVALALSGNGSQILNIIRETPREHFRFLPPGDFHSIMQYTAAWMVIGLGSIPSQDLFQRFNSARSERSAVIAGFLGSGMYLAFAILPLFIVLAIGVLHPGADFTDTQTAIPSIIMQHSSLPVQVMLLGALLSAIFSTCSGAILAPSSLLAENIIKPFFKIPDNSKSFLVILRVCVIIITLLGVIMGLGRSNIYRLVGESSVIGLVSMLVPMLNAIFGKKHYKSGALYSMLSGFTAWLVTEHIFPIEFPSLIVGLAASIGGMIIGNAIAKHKKKEGN